MTTPAGSPGPDSGEQGRSGVNYFTIRIRLEYLDADSGDWRLEEAVNHRSASFANDANDYTYPGPDEFFAERWSFTSEGNEQLYRVKVIYGWWNAKAGADERLFARKVIDAACPGSAPVPD